MLSIIANTEQLRTINNPRPNSFYSYWRLQERDWFRVFVLEPSLKPDAIIMGSLLHYEMSEVPEYEALSYTWGVEAAECPIFTDRSLFHIRRNLYSVLKVLRDEKKRRLLWVDAICIDQSHIDERNQQVVQMGQIYSNAVEVVIWLGEADNYSELGMECIAEISLTALAIASEVSSELQDRAWAGSFASFLARPDADDCLHALAVLFNREWWRRIWTLQEIVLARQATVHYGLKHHPWQIFEVFSELSMMSSVVEVLSNYRPSSEKGVRAIILLGATTIRPKTVKTIRGLRNEASRVSLSTMLSKQSDTLQPTLGIKSTLF